MESTILELTHLYVRAFDQRDLDTLSDLMDEDICLIDPAVEIEDRDLVIDYVSDLYKSNSHLNFYATNIFADEAQRFSIIEFILELGNVKLRGTDHLYWSKDSRIEKLEAFLYEKDSKSIQISHEEIKSFPNDAALGNLVRAKYLLSC
jgi:hypothetical protein